MHDWKKYRLMAADLICKRLEQEYGTALLFHKNHNWDYEDRMMITMILGTDEWNMYLINSMFVRAETPSGEFLFARGPIELQYEYDGHPITENMARICNEVIDRINQYSKV